MWQVIGQNRAVSMLRRSLEVRALSHAYLLVGPSHVGKMTLALDLARAVNCTASNHPCGDCPSCQRITSGKHPDVQVISLLPGNETADKQRAEIGVEQVKEIQHSSSLPPFEGKFKVFIIDGAENLSGEAANRLLKTIEEPEGNVIYILLTVKERAVLPTVASRCQRLELSPVAMGEVETTLATRCGVTEDKARLLARLCRGCPGWAISAATDDSLLEERTERTEKLLDVIQAGYEERFNYAVQLATGFSQSRARVQEVLDTWLSWWHDLLLIKLGCKDNITNIDFESSLLQMSAGYNLSQIRAFISSICIVGEQLRQNANPRLALEVMMLDIPGREHG